MHSMIRIPRTIDATVVEAVLWRDDIGFYRRLRRGLVASRGTADWQFDIEEFLGAATDPSRGQAFRELVCRHLLRLRLTPAELRRPDRRRIVAEGVENGTMIG